MQVSATQALTVQFLTWVATQPRTYRDAMETWRTSCPRLSIWEDAIIEGLVQVENREGQSRDQSAVTLTRRGRTLLASGR
jgi:hypothetical protein